MSLPDDIELEAGLIAGRARSTRGHDHSGMLDAIVRLQCPFCREEIVGAVLGCIDCIPFAASEYATHQIVKHWELLRHAYSRFSDGLGREL